MYPSFTQRSYIDYYNIVNEGEFHYYFGYVDSAIIFFHEAFQEFDPLSKDLYLLGMSYCKKGDTSNCRKYLIEASEKSLLFPLSMSRLDSIVLYGCFSDEREVEQLWKSCNDNIEKKRNENYGKPEIQRLIDTLKFFEYRDQMYRSLNENRHYLTSSDTSEVAREYRKASHENDSIVQAHFLDYVSENGFPSIEYGDLFTTITRHFFPSNYERAKVLLLNELKEGRLDPFYYVLMAERFEFLFYNRDCYYAVSVDSCEDEQEWPSIKMRRKEIGMSIYFSSSQWRRFSVSKRSLTPWVNLNK